MKIVTLDAVRDWYLQTDDLAEFTRGIGQAGHDVEQLGVQVDLPDHLVLVIEHLAAEQKGPVSPRILDSISYFSLCKGLFLPLSGLAPQRAAQLFGIAWQPSGDDSAAPVRKLFGREIGLSFPQKIACLLGDPFMGRRSGFRRDSLLRLLLTLRFDSRERTLERLRQVGDIAVLFAEWAGRIRGDPPLTAAEVLQTLRFLPDVRVLRKFEVLRSLFERCGRLEAYFLVKLILRNAGFGFEYQGPLLTKVLGERFQASPEAIAHAVALTDLLHVAVVLDEEGAAGLRRIQLQPLSPIRPALAGGSVEDIRQFPVWVERKYDGVRMLLHKSTDDHGSVLCGAYTRNKNEWLEQVPGLAQTIRMIPARTCIIDGELHGTAFDVDGPRPASVYDVFTMIQGEPQRPINLKFAAFDLLYLNGKDLTSWPLSARRQHLAALLAPITGMPLPIPISLTEGHLARNREDLNRLFHHFRAQGYEGIIAKDLNGPYHIATRDPAWVKRKPEITLDVVLLGGVFAVTSKATAGLFGSYVIGARDGGGNFIDIGDVAGVDVQRDRQIQSEVMRLGLLTGKRIERPSATGVRPGLEFRPGIVVTVRFEGVIRESSTNKYSLRDPKIVLIRADKSAYEADEAAILARLYIDQRLS